MRHLQFESYDRLALLGIIALATIGFAIGLGNHGPIPSMETRFAVAVQQMLLHHQWLIPEKNGLPYIEYPPFYYWLSMLLAKAGLPLLPAIRLPNLIALWIWFAAVYRLGRRLVPGLPRWLLPAAALVSPAVLYNFFVAQTDGWLAAGVTLALLGYVNAPQPRRFPWLLWGGTALAVFAKGPLGLVLVVLAIGGERLLAVGVGALAWKKFPQAILALRPLRGTALALAPLAAWYLACGLFVSWDFVRAAFVYNNITRFLAGAGGHDNPWWLYGQTIWGDYFPWSLALPLGLILAIRRLRQFSPRLLFAWSITLIIFFSLSASKQSKYLLPAVPAFTGLALMALAWVFRRHTAGLHRTMAVWIGIILLFFGVIIATWLPFASAHIDDNHSYAQLKGRVAAAPGPIVMYGWPRSLVLWQLGAPMPWFRDSRSLYGAIHSGKLRAGAYLLVPHSDLARYGARGTQILSPAPAPPYLRYITSLHSKGGFEVYRVLAGAKLAPLPKTPLPAPPRWWDRFDTD